MANMTRDAHPTLEVEGLTKQFRGLVAVDGVTFRVSKNTVHGLIGPNGAGKTTVFNMISGVLPATAGAILGIGRSKAYALAKAGKFPVRIIRVGRSYVVPTAALLDLLGL